MAIGVKTFVAFGVQILEQSDPADLAQEVFSSGFARVESKAVADEFLDTEIVVVAYEYLQPVVPTTTCVDLQCVGVLGQNGVEVV